jgi:hypothetical protein
MPSVDTPAQQHATAEGLQDARPMLVLADSTEAVGRYVASVVAACAGAGLHVAVVGPAAAQDAFRFTELGADFHTVEFAGSPARVVKALVVATAYHRATVVHAHGLRAGATALLAGRLAATAARVRRRGAGRRPVVLTRYPAAQRGFSAGLASLIAGRADRVVDAATSDRASVDLYRTFLSV